jgi:hypothetical protein
VKFYVAGPGGTHHALAPTVGPLMPCCPVAAPCPDHLATIALGAKIGTDWTGVIEAYEPEETT